MGNLTQTFRELSDGQEVTLVCEDGTEITGDVQHSSTWTEDGVRFWDREVQDDNWEAWKTYYRDNEDEITTRLEGYDDEKKVATTREKHTVDEIVVHE